MADKAWLRHRTKLYEILKQREIPAMNPTLYIELKLSDTDWQQALEQIICTNQLPGPPPAADSHCLTVTDENLNASKSSIQLFANYDKAPGDFFPSLKRQWALRQTEIFNRAACESLQALGSSADDHLQRLAAPLN